MEHGCILMDDLRFEAIAKAKMLEKRQIEDYRKARDKLITNPELRQRALEDDLGDVYEIENNFKEQDAREQAARELKLTDDLEVDESSFDSEASRINFWKDLMSEKLAD